MNTYPPCITSRKHILRFRFFLLSIFCLALFDPTTPIHAQQLGLEGETGGIVTPLAYAVSTSEHKFALPVVAYHFLRFTLLLSTLCA